jgi:hypothetical protein
VTRTLPCSFLALCGLLLVFWPNPSRADLKLEEGDRVVLLGNTLIEREQRSGYWEAALTAQLPGKKLLVRNLGWSGDTVFGTAQAGFGSVADGFRHLKEHTLALKPTVLVIGYGSVEAFDGPEGLPGFVAGLNTLLDTLEPAKARLVLLSPLRQEDLGRPLPDPTTQNRNLRLYTDALRTVAKKRGATFVDLYDSLPDGARATPPAPLTDNGIHLTPWGYWRSSFALAKELGLREANWQIEVNASTREARGSGAVPGKVVAQAERIAFPVRDDLLPPAPPPSAGAPEKPVWPFARTLTVKELPAGSYTLTIDGKEVHTASAAQWAKGVRLTGGPEFDQAEKLRQTIVAKDELYFHRWRPQNETYLFGFRKHEQGKNAREIPQFDPLVADKEADIVKLSAPVERKYELKRTKTP